MSASCVPCYIVYGARHVAECGIMFYLKAASRMASFQYGVGSVACWEIPSAACNSVCVMRSAMDSSRG